MANVCLPKQAVDTFRQALKSGTINPEKLAGMTSEERHAFFEGIVGKGDAKTVNSLFESKLLLKNQQQGMLTWAKSVAGLKPAERRTLEDKIARMNTVLNPSEERAFLKDLVSTRLGMDVSAKEAKQIADLSAKLEEAKALPRSSVTDSLKKGWTPTANDLKYGYARYDFHERINDLKHEASKFKLADLKGKSAIQAVPILTKTFVDATKSIGASLDDSFALRQGSKAFWSNNRQWQKQFIESFRNIAKGFKNTEAANRDFNARLMADPHYDQAIKDGLAIRGNEDAYPTSLPEKIPGFGRAFGATELAYNAFAQNLRLSIYKTEMRQMEELGAKDVPKDFGKNMAKMVNSLTGRGGFGKLEPVSGVANVAFYSLRFLKSNIDTLLAHPLGSGVGGTVDYALRKEGAQVVSAAQKKAAINLAKIIVGTAGVLATAKALNSKSVDFDPRSSDFGKIRIGDTRFDVTGGMGSIAVLASQLASYSTKSSTTGIISKLNTGDFGSKTQVDVLINFLENKASPVGGVALDYGKGTDHNGNKPTVKSEAANLFTPLGIKNYLEVKNDPHSANVLATVLADTFGISANTYGKSNKNTTNNLSSAALDFQKAVGTDKFNQATKDYNTQLDDWMAAHKADLNALPQDEQKTTLARVKTRIQNNIYKQYGYKPPKTSMSGAAKTLLDSVKK